MGGNVSGKFLDGHHIGILGNGEGVLLLGRHEVEVGLLRRLAHLLSHLDAPLGLVDLKEVRVHAAHHNTVVDHSSSSPHLPRRGAVLYSAERIAVVKGSCKKAVSISHCKDTHDSPPLPDFPTF